jgi:NAD(P)-dependent dehydrogenase (short-subunit alcohol dehydrogenase family)
MSDCKNGCKPQPHPSVDALRGKTAVVTGAGSGIGRGIALALAAEGMNLGLLDIDASSAEETQLLAASIGVRSHAAAVDISDRDALRTTADALRSALGSVHVVCCNAGVGFRAPVHETPDEVVDWLFAVNVVGTLNTAKAFVPAMIARGEPGHVVVTASENALFEFPKHQNGIYCATKMALLGLSASMREELRSHAIGVTAFCPGLTNTNSRQSGRHRPERFGGPFDRLDQKREKVGLDPADAGRVVVRAIRDDTFLATTHPTTMREHYVERSDGVLEALDRWEAVLPELGIAIGHGLAM